MKFRYEVAFDLDPKLHRQIHDVTTADLPAHVHARLDEALRFAFPAAHFYATSLEKQ